MPYAVNPTIFRAYDIRGVVDVDLSEEVYRALGRAAEFVLTGWITDSPGPAVVHNFCDFRQQRRGGVVVEIDRVGHVFMIGWGGYGGKQAVLRKILPLRRANARR